MDSQPTASPKSLKSWVEKYRPSQLNDIVYQNEIVQSLENIIRSHANNLPNFLFHGPPGTGKTSTIIALSKQLFGPDLYKKRILELNASDERGIQVIRDKVKLFAQQTISKDDESIPALKIIVLDECDSMTKDAQSALRRIMEKYSKTTRFCLICNYVSKIIDPLISRCVVYRFKSLKNDLIRSTLLKIGDNEGFNGLNDELLDTLTQISDGDLRKSITLLQTMSMISRNDDKDTENSNKLTTDDVYEIAGQIPQRYINNYFLICCHSKSYAKLLDETKKIVRDGYSIQQFLYQLQEWIALADKSLLTDGQKSKICWEIAQADKRLLDGGDEFVQLLHIGSFMMQTMS